MTLPDFTESLVGFVWVFANLLVCGLACQLYQHTGRRSVLLLAIAAGLGAVSTLFPWLRPMSSSWGYWYMINSLHILDAGLWLVGSWLLFREFGELWRKFNVQPGAAPNGGQAASVDNSITPDGPPSVS